MGAGDGETVEEWRARKMAQGMRFTKLEPGLQLHCWQDYHTRFDLVCKGQGSSLCIGRLQRGDDVGVDLTDEQIGVWVKMLQLAVS